jgi:transcriptional regulator of arginine metabolism
MHNLNNSSSIISTLKSLINERQLSSQKEIINLLTSKGFNRINQAKVSRLLTKIGANKVRDSSNKPIYQLPFVHDIPKLKQSINDVVINIQHNGTHIVIHTTNGGAGLITKYLEPLQASHDILGCIASDNTILVIPSQTARTEVVMNLLKSKLNI